MIFCSINLHFAITKAEPYIWMLSHHIHLLLELERINPVVITLTKGNEFTTTTGTNATAIAAKLGYIFMPPEDADFVWIFLLVLETDFAGLVVGAVFTNDEFEFEVSLLHHYAFNRLPNVWLVIVGDHVNRDNRMLAKFLGV